MSAFGALQTVNDRRYPWAGSRQRAVPKGGLAIFLTVAIVVGSVLPAPAGERPSDPFGNHTAELNKDDLLVGIWDWLKDKMQLGKAYFHECLLLKEPPSADAASWEFTPRVDPPHKGEGRSLRPA
jgi:hypothetical protein